jgi:enoyl-CoA hydratase
MNYETLNFAIENQIGLLTINRPESLNALNAKVISEMKDLLYKIKDEKNLRAIIVTGSGDKAFVAGADIKEMDERPSDSGVAMANDGQAVLQMLEDLPVPSIAAVNGFALGGGLELAMACDFIVASKKAKMGLPEVSLGLIPGYGGTQRLARYCGKGVARLVTLTGDIYSAEQFEKWGLVALVVEPSELMEKCKTIAGTIAKRSPTAIALAKRAIYEGVEMSQFEGLRLESELFGKAFASEDKKEGVSAFIAKRPPEFSGR